MSTTTFEISEPDEALFKDPHVTSATNPKASIYKACCGKTICLHLNETKEECPFCRASYSGDKFIELINKRVEDGDAQAIDNLGCYYKEGKYGLPQDHARAMELWYRAGELGYAFSYNNIGIAYLTGLGVERDIKKARHYLELAAIGGDAYSRFTLGSLEEAEGNMDKALRHHMVEVRFGDNDSLTKIKLLYSSGLATRDDYANALQAYQAYLDETKSDNRDKAAIKVK